VIQAWPALPPHLKQAITSIVNSVPPTTRTPPTAPTADADDRCPLDRIEAKGG